MNPSQVAALRTLLSAPSQQHVSRITLPTAVRDARAPRELDGNSNLGLLLLGAARGSTIAIRTDGADAEAAADALAALVADGFGES